MQSRAAAPIPLALPGTQENISICTIFLAGRSHFTGLFVVSTFFSSVSFDHIKIFGSNVAHVHCHSVEAFADLQALRNQFHPTVGWICDNGQLLSYS